MLQDFLSEKDHIKRLLQDTMLRSDQTNLNLQRPDYFGYDDFPFLPAVKKVEVFKNAPDFEQIDSIFTAIDQFVDSNTETTTDAATEKVVKKYDNNKLGKWVQFHHPPKPSANDADEVDASAFQPTLPGTSKPSARELYYPDQKEVKRILATERLILSVHSLQGYNFSSEFTLIYGGNFASKRIYENTIAILQKALQAADHTLQSEDRARLATYLLDQVMWENECKEVLFEQLLQHHFPRVAEIGFVRNIDFAHAHLYVGKEEGSGELVAHLRFEDDVVLLDQKTRKAEGDNLLKRISYHSIALPSRLEEIEGFFLKKTQLLAKQETVRTRRKGSRSKTMDAALSSFLQQSSDRSRFYLVNAALLVTDDQLGEGMDIGVGVGRESEEVQPVDSEEARKSESESERLMALDANAPRSFKSESSFCSELIAWGFDSYFSMGLGKYRRERILSREGEREGEEGEEAAVRLEDELYDPRPLPLTRNITIERVSMIACSSRHTLLLTHFGSLYATGENSEGALGLGDTLPRASFTLVDYHSHSHSHSSTGSERETSPGKLVFIAAGAGSLGAHSMAIDSEGRLYGWGFNKATGCGSLQPVNRPTRVSIPRLQGLEGESGSEGEERIRMVGCGDGFSVCLTHSGLVYTWGQWAHGRLGLGQIPVSQTTARRSLASRFSSDQGAKKLLKYQLRPARVLGLDDVIQVVCGEAHTLALLRDRSVVAWGQNTLGQLGTGPSRSGLLRDAFTPVLVSPFIAPMRRQTLTPSTSNPSSSKLVAREPNHLYSDFLSSTSLSPSVAVRNIYCGAFHSLCVDVEGGCWSWGSRGSPCLGHADTALLGDWGNKITALFSLSSSDTEKMVPFELLNWCLTWSMPRRISALEGVEVVHVSAGDLHSAFLSSSGRVYLTGSGPAVPPFSPPNRILDEGNDDDEEEEEDKNKNKNKDKDSARRERGKGKGKGRSSSYSQSQVVNDVVSSPRCPSASWLKDLCTRNIRYVASGGSRVFVLIDEELISPRVTTLLYRKLLRGDRDREEEGVDQHEQESDHDATMSIDSRYSDFTSSQFSSILDSRGKADCMVIASGHIFLCHKALLALRSPELRNMIIMEAPIEVEAGLAGGGGAGGGGSGEGGGTSSSTSLVQILLPELNRDAARALFFFLYRDSLPVWAIGQLSTLSALSRIGKSLRIPRLFLLAERFIDILAFNNALREREREQLQSSDDDPPSSDSHTSSDERLVEEMPPPTLVRDLGSLLGDPEFADVRFIAESRAVAAHRFVLEGRCEYFRAMFRSGMAEGFSPGRAVIDVVVPDSFVGFLRLLIFIYTNTLPDGSDGALLEDLMAADRYGITEMKELVENMLKPSLFNWVDLLRAAELLNSPKLKTSVLSFLRSNFHVLQLDELSQQLEVELEVEVDEDEADSKQVDRGRGRGRGLGRGQQSAVLRQLKEEFPSLLEEIIGLRSFYSPLPPSSLLIEEGKLTKESSLLDEDKHPFPFGALALGAVSLFVYQYATQILPIGPIVPIVNIGGFFLLMLYGFRILNK